MDILLKEKQNITTKEYYRGYLKVNDTKEYLEKVDNEYKFFVYSQDHLYNKTTSINIIDNKGNDLGCFENTEAIRKEETKQLKNQLLVYHINYNFYLLPTGVCSTIDDVHNCTRFISSVFNIKEHGRSYDVNNYIRAYEGENTDRYYSECFTPSEICQTGHSVGITNKTFKKLFDLDIKEYTKNKNAFIKLHPDREERVEFLYKINIGYLMLFWGVTKKQLLNDKFCRRSASISKLNRKITLKLKS